MKVKCPPQYLAHSKHAANVSPSLSHSLRLLSAFNSMFRMDFSNPPRDSVKWASTFTVRGLGGEWRLIYSSDGCWHSLSWTETSSQPQPSCRAPELNCFFRWPATLRCVFQICAIKFGVVGEAGADGNPPTGKWRQKARGKHWASLFSRSFCYVKQPEKEADFPIKNSHFGSCRRQPGVLYFPSQEKWGK